MIIASISSNEAMRPRAAKILAAIRADERFTEGQSEELPFDMRIRQELECQQCHGEPLPEELDEESGEMIHVTCGHCIGHVGIVRRDFHVEIKDFSEDAGSDYLASILNGHLYEQILAARERQEPVAVVVLGDDSDVGAAIRKAASHATSGHRVDPGKLMEYYNMVEGFESNCIALGVPVWRLKTDPYGRMLMRVRKILEGGDLTGFTPSPVDGERQAVGLSILAGKGIGPAKARSILKNFQLILEPWYDDCYLTDCDGIGENLARRLGDSKIFAVDPRKIIRPKEPKKQKQKAEAKK